MIKIEYTEMKIELNVSFIFKFYNLPFINYTSYERKSMVKTKYIKINKCVKNNRPKK